VNNFCSNRVKRTLITFSQAPFNLVSVNVSKVAEFQEKIDHDFYFLL